MAAFSEEELLLLSNYVYMDCSLECDTISETVSRYSDPKSLPEMVGGEMTRENATDVLSRLGKLTEKGGSLEGARITRTLDEGNVRALCVVKESGEAAVIFRGTGGSYEAWSDNVKAQYITETNMQKIAADFVQCDCMEYDDLTVSGHSKGGNLAQYVTVLNPDRVEKCVSFDGQGFSADFLREHKDGIDKTSGRITSICANNDYVNILLNTIAGEVVYIANKNNDPVGAHCSYSLLEYGKFDASGNVIRDESIKQGIFASTLDKVTDALTDGLSKLPGDGNAHVSGLLAAFVANLMGGDKEVNDIDEEQEIKNAVSGVTGYLNNYVHLVPAQDGKVPLCADAAQSDNGAMSCSIREFDDMLTVFRRDMARIDEIQKDLSVNIVAGVSVAMCLNPVKERFYADMDRLEQLVSCLSDVRRMYADSEMKIANMV